MSTGNMSSARLRHTVSILANGEVLVTGGFGDSSNYLNSAELCDPSTGSWTGSWTATGNMNTARQHHTASTLTNGKVLVTDGCNGIVVNSAELYDPSTGSWTTRGNMAAARRYHTASVSANGRVLFAGGEGISGSLTTAEWY
jgi:N-acetylneuraminic acid mutarotase